MLLTFTNLNADTVLFPKNQKGNNIYLGSKYLFSQNNENNFNPLLNLHNTEIKTFKEEELWQKFLKYFMKTNHICTEVEIAESPKTLMDESSITCDIDQNITESMKINQIFQSNYQQLKKK